MSDAESIPKVEALERRIADLERAVMASDLRQTALVASWFAAKSKKDRARVLAEMKAIIRVHEATLDQLSEPQRGAAEDFVAGMKRLRASLKA